MTISDKEIARDILVKLLETNAIFFEQSTAIMSTEKRAEVESQNLRRVCIAYETILRTVAASNLISVWVNRSFCPLQSG